MPKIAKEITAIEVKRLHIPGLVFVGGVTGLALQITPSGSRSWVLRVKVGEKRHDIGLGAYPGVTLAQARQKAAEARSLIAQGRDPLEERRVSKSRIKADQAAAMTFERAADGLIAAKSAEWSNPKSEAQWRSTLENYVFPTIGKLDVRHVTQQHVESILEPIWSTKTETATRVRGRIENILDWAIAGGFRTGENPARWRGLLDKRLGNPAKLKRVEHYPAVAIDQIHAFYLALQLREGLAARALGLVLLTATRSGEARGATWSEIDLKTATWTIPKERMKASKEHRVPLSVPALEILMSLPRMEGSEFVFPAARGGKLSDAALGAVMDRMSMIEVPHGLRSSFRDWASERTTFPRDLAEMALAHVVKDKVEAAYRRGDMLERRRPMMDAWAKFVQTEPVGGAEIITLHQINA
jgi:integrase